MHHDRSWSIMMHHDASSSWRIEVVREAHRPKILGYIYIYCRCRGLGRFKDCTFFFVSFCAGRVSEMGVRTVLFHRYSQMWGNHVPRKLRVSQNLYKSTICHVFLKNTFRVFYIFSWHHLSWFQIKPSILYQNITHYNTLMSFQDEDM